MGTTPLFRAAREGHTEIVQLLLHAGAGANKFCEYYRYTPLHWAAFKGHTDIVRLLLGAVADPSQRDHQGMTPLVMAWRKRHKETAKLIWQHIHRMRRTTGDALSHATGLPRDITQTIATYLFWPC